MMLTTNVATHSVPIEAAMIDHSTVLNGVETLKWLVIPAAAAPVMITSSISRRMALIVPAHHATRCKRCNWPINHDQVTA